MRFGLSHCLCFGSQWTFGRQALLLLSQRRLVSDFHLLGGCRGNTLKKTLSFLWTLSLREKWVKIRTCWAGGDVNGTAVWTRYYFQSHLRLSWGSKNAYSWTGTSITRTCSVQGVLKLFMPPCLLQARVQIHMNCKATHEPHLLSPGAVPRGLTDMDSALLEVTVSSRYSPGDTRTDPRLKVLGNAGKQPGGFLDS